MGGWCFLSAPGKLCCFPLLQGRHRCFKRPSLLSRSFPAGKALCSSLLQGGFFHSPCCREASLAFLPAGPLQGSFGFPCAGKLPCSWLPFFHTAGCLLGFPCFGKFPCFSLLQNSFHAVAGDFLAFPCKSPCCSLLQGRHPCVSTGPPCCSEHQ